MKHELEAELDLCWKAITPNSRNNDFHFPTL